MSSLFRRTEKKSQSRAAERTEQRTQPRAPPPRTQEQVLNTGSGVKKHPLFFLDCLRRRKGAKQPEHGAVGAAEADSHVEVPADEARTPLFHS